MKYQSFTSGKVLKLMCNVCEYKLKKWCRAGSRKRGLLRRVQLILGSGPEGYGSKSVTRRVGGCSESQDTFLAPQQLSR